MPSTVLLSVGVNESYCMVYLWSVLRKVACGVDAGGVRAALWCRALSSGSLFTEEDVEEHLVGASDHRYLY